jgi:hypothetical protein
MGGVVVVVMVGEGVGAAGMESVVSQKFLNHWACLICGREGWGLGCKGCVVVGVATLRGPAWGRVHLSQVDSISAIPNILCGWPRGTNP